MFNKISQFFIYYPTSDELCVWVKNNSQWRQPEFGIEVRYVFL